MSLATTKYCRVCLHTIQGAYRRDLCDIYLCGFLLIEFITCKCMYIHVGICIMTNTATFCVKFGCAVL